jgi:hypothetical protein
MRQKGLYGWTGVNYKIISFLLLFCLGGANSCLSKLLKKWTLIIYNLERVVADAENLASHLKKLFSQLKTVKVNNVEIFKIYLAIINKIKPFISC